MGSLGAYEDIFNKIVRGEWRDILPRGVYSSFSSWCSRNKDQEELVTRFTFNNPDTDSRYAMYIICLPQIDDRVNIRGYKSHKERPLAMIPSLYDKPLFCMPNDLLQQISKERGQS